jgi:hypothetical protein
MLLSKNICSGIVDDRPPTYLVFTNAWEIQAASRVQSAMLNVKYSEMWRIMKTLLTSHNDIHY